MPRGGYIHPIIMKTIIIAAVASWVVGISSVDAETLVVDTERCRIQVDAEATGHDFTGTLEKFTIRAAGDVETLKPTELNLSWKFNNLDTADEKRDKEMIKWLGGGEPKGSFKLVKSWDETPEGGHAQGTLTINGVSKTLAFPYTIEKDGDWITIKGKVSMDYEDFKLPLIRAMAVMTVDPKLVIRFHVVGKVK